jgi:hypothetical protein
MEGWLMPVLTLDNITSAGVSGTRDNMPVEQQHAFFDLILQQLRSGATELHHGACTGADAFAHFHMISQAGVITHVHPPTDKKCSAEGSLMRHSRRVDHEAKPYGERNDDIVAAIDVLVAAPAYPEDDPRSKRSGTWQTIRKADAAGKPVFIAAADGSQYMYQPRKTAAASTGAFTATAATGKAA